MPLFRLRNNLIFPSPDLAERDGLLCVGGDLSEERLLLAYEKGIFPWYSEGYPLLWWSPDPRLVLFPRELRVSRSLRQELNKNTYTITFDTAFPEVIAQCAHIKRKKDEGTWITREMIEAYIRLHHSGYAHSVESWHHGELAGGLYGVALGGAFFGESMFSKQSNASKAAFATLVHQLIEWNFTIVDCQVTTRHLLSLGAREISRAAFMEHLKQALTVPTRKGKWHVATRATN